MKLSSIYLTVTLPRSLLLQCMIARASLRSVKLQPPKPMHDNGGQSPHVGPLPSETSLWESKHNFTNGAGELLYMQFVSLKLVELTLNRTTVTVTTFGSDNLGFKWTQIK